MSFLKILLCSLALSLSGCDYTSNDPYESFNRGVFKFNKTLDNAIIKPIAKAYDKILHKTFKVCISSFFNNLLQPSVIINDFLQGEIVEGLKSIARMLINTTLGGFGLIDIADKIGLKQKNQDFGITLYKYGFKKSNFLILPLLGPSTPRDATSFVVDYLAFYPTNHLGRLSKNLSPNFSHKASITLGSIIDTRYRLLNADAFSAGEGFDEYLFMKNAYMQYRNKILMEASKEEPEDLDLDEDLFDEDSDDLIDVDSDDSDDSDKIDKSHKHIKDKCVNENSEVITKLSDDKDKDEKEVNLETLKNSGDMSLEVTHSKV